jgi:primosomal protein N' (replication factor Y)
MKEENNKILSDLALKGLKKYLKHNNIILIFTKKNVYASWIICQDCWYTPYCKQCDVPIARHKWKDWNLYWICHICKKQYNFPEKCPNCWGFNITTYWIWSEKIKEYLLQIFSLSNEEVITISSENINSPNKIKKFLEKIKHTKIIISTPILISGLPIQKNIPFIIIQNADIWLNLPNFNVNRRNFLFLYETFTNYDVKNFVIQTFNPDNISLKYAINLDFEWFKQRELTFRKEYNYPPFTQMAIILYKHEIEETLFNKVNKLYQELLYLKEKYQWEDLEIYPTPPLIYKIFWKYRYNIILKSKNLRDFLEIAFEKLKIYEKWFKIDRMPEDIN